MRNDRYPDLYNCQARIGAQFGAGEGIGASNRHKPVIPKPGKRQEYVLEVFDDQLDEVTKENRMQLFHRFCPKCGKVIIGRPCEWPYYVRIGNRYLWLCENCSWITKVSVIRNDG